MSLRRLLIAVTMVCGLCVWGFARSGDEPASAHGAKPIASVTRDDGTHDEAAARFRANQCRHWRQVAIGPSSTH